MQQLRREAECQMPGTTSEWKTCPTCRSLALEYERLIIARDVAFRALTSASANADQLRYLAAVGAAEKARETCAAVFLNVLQHRESHLSRSDRSS
jgi:hypothetical protein